jgi:hypothetical protein
VYKELVEKVRLLKWDNAKMEENLEMRLAGTVWNQAIDEALVMIKTCQPNVVSNPSSEGWWWYNNGGCYPVCLYVSDIDGILYVRDPLGKQVPVSELTNEWVKADVPDIQALIDSKDDSIIDTNKPEVVIKSIYGSSKWRDLIEMTEVYVDGKSVEGWYTYGGQPEDNSRERNYRWVEPLLKELAERLGAKVVMIGENRGKRDDW